MELLAAAFLAALLGILLGRWLEAKYWRGKSSMQHGRVLSGGRFFWVVAEEDRKACRYLEDLLREERQRRDMEAQMIADEMRTRNVRKP